MKIVSFYLMKNKVILISSNSAWNLLNFRINLIKNLINRKYIIKIVVPSHDRYSDILKSIGCEVYNINLILEKSLSEAILLFFKYFIYFINLVQNIIYHLQLNQI